MYGSPSAYPPAGYPLATTSSPNPYHPPPPQEYCSQPHNPYPQPPAGYPNHLQYHQPPYVRADSPQIISLAHQVNQDPNPVAFLTFYRRILDELTANSKYIINHATIIASELLNRANDIARCLDDHIMQVSVATATSSGHSLGENQRSKKGQGSKRWRESAACWRGRKSDRTYQNLECMP